MSALAQAVDISEEDHLRAQVYGFLARGLLFSPTQQELDIAKKFSGDDSDLGIAFSALSQIASKVSLNEVIEEYDGLFVGVGRGELLPFGSYYLTGFLNEKPLAKLRTSMRELGIARQPDVSEPEDHIGSLMEMMAGLINGSYGEPLGVSQQRKFFEAHIEPWAGHFFRDLEGAKLSRFYISIGTIGRLFMEIESAAFAME